MPTYKLIELIDEVISGEWGQDVGEEKEGVKVIRTTNFSNTGKLDLNKEVVLRNIDKAKVEEKKLQLGDIIIEKSGGSPDQPVGRVVYFEEEELYLCNNFTSVLRPKKELVIPKFLMYVLFNLHRTKKVLKFQNKTTGIINLKLEQYLNQTTVIIPSLEIQSKVVRSLDQAYGLIEKRQSQITALDELTKSLFLEMFGDPVSNSKGWGFRTLKDFGDWRSGGTPSKLKKEYYRGNIPWFSSGELNDIYVSKSLEHITEKAVEESSAKYIEEGSILLGMYDTAALKSSIVQMQCTCNQAIAFSRLDNNKVSTLYVYQYIQMAKEHLKRQQRGVRQKNMNLSMIKDLIVMYPPLELQLQFEEKFLIIEEKKRLMIEGLNQVELLYNSLLQKAFKGELFQEQ